jgi:hypothetical protein
MALYCLVSPGGSPGATTTALTLALTWPVEVVLAECDPAGRRVLPGFLAERLDGSPGPGLLGLAMAINTDAVNRDARVEDYTIPLTGQGRAWLLHGIRDPRHARQLGRLWEPLAETFTASGVDVIADVGRIGGADTPLALLTRADLVVMVLHRSLAQVDAAQPRLDALLGMLNGHVPVVLCLIEEGPYSAAEVQKALFDLPVLADLPHAVADARVLSDGAQPRLAFRTSLLMRAAASLGHQMRTVVEGHAFHPGTLPMRSGGGR